MIHSKSVALKLRRKSWALNNLDRKLNKYLNHKWGFFIELGANDGISQSNSMYLEKHYGWKGLLIEPHLPSYIKLIENRSKDNFFYNCACVAFDFEPEEYRYIYSNLMSIGIDDENEIQDRFNHAKKGLAYLEDGEKNEVLNSKARTLDSILKETNSPNLIDFMSLDVEGAELAVLRGIDFQIYRFKFMLVESRSIEKIELFLAARGYELIEQMTIHDYLFGYVGGEYDL